MEAYNEVHIKQAMQINRNIPLAGKKVLEIGCGGGALLTLPSEQATRVTAMSAERVSARIRFLILHNLILLCYCGDSCQLL